jgi:hypothetical protein
MVCRLVPCPGYCLSLSDYDNVFLLLRNRADLLAMTRASIFRHQSMHYPMSVFPVNLSLGSFPSFILYSHNPVAIYVFI